MNAMPLYMYLYHFMCHPVLWCRFTESDTKFNIKLEKCQTGVIFLSLPSLTLKSSASLGKGSGLQITGSWVRVWPMSGTIVIKDVPMIGWPNSAKLGCAQKSA